MDFPESAHKAVGILGELRALFAATEEMALNPPGPADVAAMEQTVKHLRELTRISEVEINAIIQSCRKARQKMLETYVMERPGTLHCCDNPLRGFDGVDGRESRKCRDTENGNSSSSPELRNTKRRGRSNHFSTELS